MKKQPSSKYLIVIRGKGTPKAQNIPTAVKVYWSKSLQKWVSIPESE